MPLYLFCKLPRYSKFRIFLCKFPSNDINNKCSEFEELEAVSTMAIMDGPLEPSSSTASNAAGIPDDPAFVNFFSVSIFLNIVTLEVIFNAFGSSLWLHAICSTAYRKLCYPMIITFLIVGCFTLSWALWWHIVCA